MRIFVTFFFLFLLMSLWLPAKSQLFIENVSKKKKNMCESIKKKKMFKKAFILSLLMGNY